MILKENERVAEEVRIAMELELRFQAEQEEKERLEEEDRIAVLAAEALLQVNINPILSQLP
jgi:hypothetical protein